MRTTSTTQIRTGHHSEERTYFQRSGGFGSKKDSIGFDFNGTKKQVRTPLSSWQKTLKDFEDTPLAESVVPHSSGVGRLREGSFAGVQVAKRVFGRPHPLISQQGKCIPHSSQMIASLDSSTRTLSSSVRRATKDASFSPSGDPSRIKGFCE